MIWRTYLNNLESAVNRQFWLDLNVFQIAAVTLLSLRYRCAAGIAACVRRTFQFRYVLDDLFSYQRRF